MTDEARDYRIRPVESSDLDRVGPLKFRARTDDEARSLYRHGRAAIVAKGWPLLPMILERHDPAGAWVEVRTES